MSVFRITDVVGMARAMRDDVFDNPEVGYPHESIGMDGYVTVQQIVDKTLSLSKRDDEGELYITGKGLDELELFVTTSITESALARLAAYGLIEVMVDEDGVMTFYRKDEEEEVSNAE